MNGTLKPEQEIGGRMVFERIREGMNDDGVGMFHSLAPALAADPATVTKPKQSPLLDDGAMIRVPVTAFGQTLYFIVDTGFTISAFDSKYGRFLRGQVAAYVGDTPLGNKSTMAAFRCDSLCVAGHPAGLDKIVCADLRMAALISGQPCDGILGLDYFLRNVVSLDFDNNIFTVHKAVPDAVKNTAEAVPVKNLGIFCSMDAVLDGGRSLELMIDTGDTSSLSLNLADWHGAFAEDSVTVATNLTDSVNEVFQGQVGAIAGLRVAGFRYENLHATLLRNMAGPSHIGLGFFRRHRVTFDLGNGMVYLRPGRKFAERDREDMSGLHLLRESGATFVYSIDAESPGSIAGVRPKDIIEWINGQSAQSLTLNEIRMLLQSQDGETVRVVVRRGQMTMELAIRLAQTI